MFWVGTFLDSVWLTTRTPRGAYARRARRNRINRHWGGIEWLRYSDLTEGNDSPALFVKKGALSVDPSTGTFSLLLQPNELYTVTTLTTGSKGNHTIPPPSAMRTPYRQTFDDEAEHAPPRLWYDQQGAWEVHDSGDAAHGKVMQQMTTVWPAGWHGPPHVGPTTYFGQVACPTGPLYPSTPPPRARARTCTHTCVHMCTQPPLTPQPQISWCRG